MMSCHTKLDRSTTPSRFVDRRYGVKEVHHEELVGHIPECSTMKWCVIAVALAIINIVGLCVYIGVTMVGQ